MSTLGLRTKLKVVTEKKHLHLNKASDSWRKDHLKGGRYCFFFHPFNIPTGKKLLFPVNALPKAERQKERPDLLLEEELRWQAEEYVINMNISFKKFLAHVTQSNLWCQIKEWAIRLIHTRPQTLKASCVPIQKLYWKMQWDCGVLKNQPQDYSNSQQGRNPPQLERLTQANYHQKLRNNSSLKKNPTQNKRKKTPHFYGFKENLQN